MKLAAITDEISMDLDRALGVMAEYGCSAAELRTLWDVNIGDLSDAQVDDALRILEARRMPVCCLASPLYKCDLPGSEAAEKGPSHQASDRTYADQLPLLRRCHELCKRFDTRLIRIFAFWSVGELTPRHLDAIVDSISDGVKYAEDNGITLLMENEAACMLKTGAHVAELMQRIDSPALKAVWDPGNALLSGETPYPGGYAAIRNCVEHVHVKDAVRLADGTQKFVVVGEGEVDYKGQFAALNSDGYSGFISLETHYRPFAGTAEQASRLCLQSLNAFLADL